MRFQYDDDGDKWKMLLVIAILVIGVIAVTLIESLT